MIDLYFLLHLIGLFLHATFPYSIITILQLPPITAVLGGFSRAFKVNEAGAYSNWAVDEQSNHNKDIAQIGHLLATLLGKFHSSSECIKVNKCHYLWFRKR